jgi:two-component system sensor histidine kinase AlgZ
MYPILAHKGALPLYLACWIPNAVLIATLFVFSGRLDWISASALALPMTAIYAFICLSSWHLCRSLPLQETSLFRLLTGHLLAAFLSASIWILIGKGLVTLLGSLPSLSPLPENYRSLIPLLVIVGILLFLLGVAVSYLLIFFEKSREYEKRSLELRLLAQQAEMKALKAQIDPHFLFNSLNSISALTSIDPAGSRKMCLLLSDFLRKSLSLGSKKFITLEEELELISKYLSIEEIRLGPRLKITMSIAEESKQCILPPLLLQPLVENALNHGIRHLLEGGEVRIVAEKMDNRLRIAVENPQDPEKPGSKSEGMGLDNVRRRLRTMFVSEGQLECVESENTYRAAITLPAKTLKEMPYNKSQ